LGVQPSIALYAAQAREGSQRAAGSSFRARKTPKLQGSASSCETLQIRGVSTEDVSGKTASDSASPVFAPSAEVQSQLALAADSISLVPPTPLIFARLRLLDCHRLVRSALNLPAVDSHGSRGVRLFPALAREDLDHLAALNRRQVVGGRGQIPTGCRRRGVDDFAR